MYTMSQINHIKDLSNCGYRISEISKKTGADPKTIRKWWDNAPPAVRVQDGHITVRVTPSQAVSDLLVEALGPGKD